MKSRGICGGETPMGSAIGKPTSQTRDVGHPELLRCLSRAFSGLHRKNLGLGNLWRLGEQIFRLRKEGFGDFSIQMGVAAVFVGKRIKNAILARSQLDGVPANRLALPLGKWLRGLQELFDLGFLAWFGFQLGPNGDSSHRCSLLPIRCATCAFGSKRSADR